MLNLISASRYPTTCGGQKEESMVIVTRSFINTLSHLQRRDTCTSSSSSSSSSSSNVSSFDSGNEDDEKAPLLTVMSRSLKNVNVGICKPARSGYGSFLKHTSKSERKTIALKQSISRPISHKLSAEMWLGEEEFQISNPDEMNQSIGSLYSTQTWTENENEMLPFEFDTVDHQPQTENGEKSKRRESVESFASSERCYGFF